MTTPAYPERRRREDNVREIGAGTTFRDSMPPAMPEPREAMSPMVRLALENAAKGEGLHRGRKGLS